jgi:hypothetical protein
LGSHTARRIAVTTAALLALVAVTATPAAARPDLVVTGTSWTDYTGLDPELVVAGPGAQLRITERTRNAGDDFAARSSTTYLLRRTDGRTTRLGSRSVEALAPRGSTRSAQDVFVTEAVAPGAYRVLACADGARRLREESERNNCRTAPGLLRVTANERPAVFIGGGAATGAVIGAIVEDTPSLPFQALTVSDPNDTQLTGATLRIIGGAGGAGSLAIKTGSEFGVILVYEREEEAEITGTYDTGTGILTLTGTASVADYQAALRSVWVVLDDDDPPSRLKLEARVRDAAGFWSGPNRRTFPVTPVNDRPKIAFRGPRDDQQRVAANIVLFDSDSRLAGATVRFASGFQSGDTLAFTNQRGITGTYDSGTGVLTLTGNATVPDYQAALRSVTAPGGSGAGRVFEFRVTDTDGAASSWTREDGEVFD